MSSDVYQHFSELYFVVFYQAMKNWFALTDNQSEQIFDAQRHRHLAMRLNLRQIDDSVILFKATGYF
jgi:hypothetical protein